MSDCRTKEETDKLVKRLNRIEGQVKGIKNMIVEDRECMEILNQLRSVSSALKGVWEIMAAKHIEHCWIMLLKKSVTKQSKILSVIYIS